MTVFASGFSWYQLLPGVGDGSLGHTLGLATPHEAWVIPAAWAGAFVILGVAVLARMGLESALKKDGPERFIPDSGFTPRNLLEIFVEGFYNLVEGILGHKEAPRFFPLTGSIFLYIVVSNLMGLIPGLLPATENFSNNLAMALVVFVVFNYAGLSRNGMAYIRHLAGPMLAVAPLLFPLEVLGLLIRPASLTIRLTANMFADHTVSMVMRQVSGDLLGWLGAAVIPVPFYALGLFVCVIQGFVFSLLSTAYVGLSTADMSHGHDDHHH